MKPINITLFDDITDKTAAQVRAALEAQPSAPVVVRINSYGGDPLAATAIYNALQAHRGGVKIAVEGIAASAATLVCCAGHCSAAENALFMVHGAWTRNGGNARQLRQSANVLDKSSDAMARIYAQKTHRPLAEIRNLLADGQDHWMTAHEALSWGLINEISAPLAIAARLGHLTLPERLMESVTESPATIEARAVAAERQRIAEISAKFNLALETAPSQAPALAALQNRLVGSGASVQEAVDQILSVVGAQSEPRGAGQGFMGAGYAAQTPVTIPAGPLTQAFYAQHGGLMNPIPYGGHGVSEFVSAAADALAGRMGATLDEAHPAARDFRGVSLVGMGAMALQASGINPTGLSADRLIRAAMTTSDFPVLLQESGNRTLVSVFEDLAQSHRDLCTLGDAPDFKAQKSANLSMYPALALKPEAGEITYGSLTEGAEVFQLRTYARGLTLSREAMVNDDLGAFSSTIQVAANAAARLERDLVFGVLTTNANMSDGTPLFHSDHGNLDTSSKTISVEGLGLARKLMRMQQDSSGGYVLTAPRFIVCPVALETSAEALVSALTYRIDATGDLTIPAWVKALRIVADPRLDAADAGDWYLLSEPGTAPVLRLVFLNGQRAPVIEQDNDFGRDVVRWKVRMDVAAAAVGYAGAVKMS